MQSSDSNELGKSLRQLCHNAMKRNRRKNSRYNDFLTQEDEKRQKEEKIKAAKAAQNAKHKNKIKEARLLAGLPRSSKANRSVNDDAKQFLKGYNERSRFEVCGVCGTDEEPRNLKQCNDLVLETIKVSDLPRYRSYLIGKLNREWHRGYLESIEAEFDEYGMLRGTRYICKWCWACFKPETKKQTTAIYMDVVEEEVLQDVNQSCSSNGNSSSNGNVYCETSNEDGQHNPDGEDSGDEYDRVPELQDDSSDEEGENDEENDEEGDEREKDVEGKFAEDSTVWKLPVRTFLRGLYPGIVPEELRVLTLVEISMVSLYNPITRISMGKVSFYHGKGNMYTIINDITRVAQTLPSMPKLDEFATLRYVNEKGNESDFRYRPNRVRTALDWLKKNNHLYQDVPIVYPEDWPDEHTEAGEQCIDIVPLEVTVEEAETLQEARKEAMEMEDSNISTNTGKRTILFIAYCIVDSVRGVKASCINC